MAQARGRHGAIVGVAEHGNSAVLITLGPDCELLDRRRIDLTNGLPTHPYHHEGSWAIGRYADSAWARKITLPEAVALVRKVHEAAARGAIDSLAKLASTVPMVIEAIAVRACPKLPETIEQRIRDTRAANVADSILYREALGAAAQSRGWSVRWYDKSDVTKRATTALGGRDVDKFLAAMGKSIGPPWQAIHKLAATAAIAARG